MLSRRNLIAAVTLVAAAFAAHAGIGAGQIDRGGLHHVDAGFRSV